MQWIICFNYVYYAILLLSFLTGLYRYRLLDDASKVFVIITGSDFIFEMAAFYAARRYSNNMSVYAVHSLVEFYLICLYFNYSIDIFIKKKIGYYFGAAGCILWVINLVFFQKLNSLSSYFLIFEGICTIGMSLFAFFRLLLKHDLLRLYIYPHFWFATILVFFWSTTFLNWGVYEYFAANYKTEMWIVNVSILAINILAYFSIGCIFILYPKMIKGE